MRVSTSTIARRLKKVNIRARRAARKLFISPIHAESRLAFGNTYVGETDAFWEGVIYCDEKSFGYDFFYLHEIYLHTIQNKK